MNLSSVPQSEMDISLQNVNILAAKASFYSRFILNCAIFLGCHLGTFLDSYLFNGRLIIQCSMVFSPIYC